LADLMIFCSLGPMNFKNSVKCPMSTFLSNLVPIGLVVSEIKNRQHPFWHP
jgi:hypothetical protein